MYNENIKDRLEKLIENNKDKGNYAVFDCDNTILMNDIQFATLHYALKFKKFKNNIENLKKILKIDDVVNNFLILYEKALNSDINSDVYLEFLANVEEFLNYYRRKYQIKDIFQIFFNSMSENEFKTIINEAIKYHSSINFDIENWIYEDNISSYKIGLSIASEMKDLIISLYDNNIDVYVISASPLIEVLEVLKPINKYIKGVYAKHLQLDENQLLTGFIDNNKIATIGYGKVKIIDEFLIPKYFKEPILVSGDSFGDYEMLTKYTNTEISLLIDRNKCEKFNELVTLNKERYLIQRVDETKGIFISLDKSLTI